MEDVKIMSASNLYAIKREFDDTISIITVNVEKETDKQYRIRDKHLCRNIVNKSDLNCIVQCDRLLFTNDLQRGIEIWNYYFNFKISQTKDLLTQYEKALVTVEEVNLNV